MSLLVACVSVASLVCASCGAVQPTEPHSVGGVTAADAFEDRQLRALAEAACTGDTTRVAGLVDQGANVNGRGLDGMTPLIWALTCESHAGMQALLEQGADPNQRVENNRGENAVIYAASYFDETLLALLLEHGGDPDSYTFGDHPSFALIEAFRMGDRHDDWDTYQLLQEAGALPTIPESTGVRPVWDVLDFLIMRGRFCEAEEYSRRGFEFTAERRIMNLAYLHYEPGHEEQCRRALIDTIEADLTQEQIEGYWEWNDRGSEPVSYSRILNP